MSILIINENNLIKFYENMNEKTESNYIMDFYQC